MFFYDTKSVFKSDTTRMEAIDANLTITIPQNLKKVK